MTKSYSVLLSVDDFERLDAIAITRGVARRVAVMQALASVIPGFELTDTDKYAWTNQTRLGGTQGLPAIDRVSTPSGGHRVALKLTKAQDDAVRRAGWTAGQHISLKAPVHLGLQTFAH